MGRRLWNEFELPVSCIEPAAIYGMTDLGSIDRTTWGKTAVSDVCSQETCDMMKPKACIPLCEKHEIYLIEQKIWKSRNN